MFQQELLNNVQQELPENTSLIEAVVQALDISYDAAHRRVSLKSKFSLAEGIQLAKYYNLSLDVLFGVTKEDFIAVRKTQSVESQEELQMYFESSYTSLKDVFSSRNNQIIYSAKDIPLFYTLSESCLTRFKFYTWLKVLDSTLKNEKFENFYVKPSLIRASEKLLSVYDGVNITEIWDITTINSTLKQIQFYHKANQLTLNVALSLCEELRQLIDSIFQKVSENTEKYQLYYNELFLMNNNVLVTTPTQQILYVPFSILSYYTTKDKITCSEAELFLRKQLAGSKLLNTAGEADRNYFFNKMYKKIDALLMLLRATQEFDFE